MDFWLLLVVSFAFVVYKLEAAASNFFTFTFMIWVKIVKTFTHCFTQARFVLLSIPWQRIENFVVFGYVSDDITVQSLLIGGADDLITWVKKRRQYESIVVLIYH